MTSNYIKGRCKEYACIDALKNQGYTCIRAASSKGSFDVVAWKEGEGPRMIQIKREKDPTNQTYPAERRKMFNTSIPKDGVRELWVWNNAIRAWRLKLQIISATQFEVLHQYVSPQKPKGRPPKSTPKETVKKTKPRKGAAALLAPSPSHASTL